MKQRTLTSWLVVLSSLLPALARGQATAAALPDRTPAGTIIYHEGPGFRFGNAHVTLHPGVDVETGGDSNVFYGPNAVGAGLLRVRAHLDLGTLPPQSFENDNSTSDPKLDFRLSTQVEYREYLSADSHARDLRSVNAYADGNVSILPRGKYTLIVSDGYLRTMDPRNDETLGSFIRDWNHTGVLTLLRPGNGAIEIGIGNDVQVTAWENETMTFGNSVSTEGSLSARWRLPNDAYVATSVRLGYFDYWRQGGTINSIPLRTYGEGGIRLAHWVSLTGALGYGNSLNRQGPSFNNVLARGELTFFLPYHALATLGYDRNFYDSVYANFFLDDNPYLSFAMPIGERLLVRLQGGVRFRHYAGLIAPTVIPGVTGYGSSTRDDLVYEGLAQLSVRLSAWMSLGLSYVLLGDRTPFVFVTDDGPRPVGFVKHNVLAGLHVAY